MLPVIESEADGLPQGARRYLRGRVIKKSLFGAVHIGKDIVTNQWVVIKKCNMDRVEEKKSTAGFSVSEDIHMEIELHRRLSEDPDSCPYLVRLLDVCQDATNIYIILEHIEGGDFYGHVETNTTKIINIANPRIKRQEVEKWQEDVRKWIKQVLMCLKFMHDRNICHRDISLENTMLSKDKNAMVIDLGVAHHYEDGNFSSERGKIGKTQYMSPECFNGQYYDARANDIWCVGLMLWMSLIGAPPWDFASTFDARFVFIMRGRSGVVGLITKWGRRYMCPDLAADLLAKIFRPQKDRIRIDEALKHPFFTGRGKCAFDHYLPVPIKKYQPDSSLSQKWLLFRDSHTSLTRPPDIFKKLPPNTKDEIQKFVWERDTIAGGIFDKRNINEMSYSFSLEMADVHEIMIYYMAASRGLLKLHQAPSKLQKNIQLPVSRGHSVDEWKHVEPSWFLELNEAKRSNLVKTFTDWN